MLTLWITGVCGFTGRHLVEYLCALPERPRIVGIDLARTGPTAVDLYRRIDLAEPDAVEEAARADRPSHVVHLAAAMPPVGVADMWQVNVGGTCGLLLGLARAALTNARVVGIGSAAEYAPPLPGTSLTESSPGGGASAYGRSKWAQTRLTLEIGRLHGLETLVARPFNLIGPGLPSRLVAGWLCEQFAMRDSGEIVLGNIHSARDFLDVRDAVKAYWALALQGQAGEIYNVSSGRPVTVADLIGFLRGISGLSPRIRIDEGRIRADDLPYVVGSSAKLCAATGWKPIIDLMTSLADMLESQRSSPRSDICAVNPGKGPS